MCKQYSRLCQWFKPSRYCKYLERDSAALRFISVESGFVAGFVLFIATRAAVKYYAVVVVYFLIAMDHSTLDHAIVLFCLQNKL